MNDKDMVMAAARLAQSSPQQWDEFITALADYTDHKCVECIQSPPDMLQVTQGRAQSLVSLGRVLEDCRKTAENIHKVAANKPPK